MCSTGTRQPDLWFIALCAMALLGYGCASTLHIDSTFPRPVVESLPLDVGVYYDESLRQFTFEREADTKSAAWNIELGEAHVRLFDRVFHPLFENLVHVDSLDATSGAAPPVVVMKPLIDEYILMTPLDTSMNHYEVTIRYSLGFYSPSGDLIKRWSFSGHGKSHASMFSNSETVENATVAAMRDAAAWLVIEFTRNPGIEALLQARKSDNENETSDQDS